MKLKICSQSKKLQSNNTQGEMLNNEKLKDPGSLIKQQLPRQHHDHQESSHLLTPRIW